MYSPKKSPRDKVKAHWRNLALAVGAMTMSCDSGKGFGVVDPMPPPSTCSVRGSDVSATVEVDADKNWLLKLVSLNEDLSFNNSVAAESGSILSSKVETDGSLTVILAPQTAVLDVFMNCSDGSRVVLKVTVSESGGVVSVTLDGSDTGS